MQFLTLQEIRHQCRLDEDDPSEDPYLELIGEAAEQAVTAHLNRNLYAEEVPDDDSTGMVIKKTTKMAMLLMVGQLYENREATISGTIVTEVPLAYQYLLQFDRIIPV